MEDLKTAPPEESAQKHSDILSKILNPDSIILSCLRQHWRLVFLAGISRFLADAFSLAGAVCIKLVVQSLATNSTADALVTVL